MQIKPSSKRLNYQILDSKELRHLVRLSQDLHIREFMMEGLEMSPEECAELLEACELLRKRTGLGLYLILLNEQIIGYCGFMETRPVSEDIDLVYAFPKEYAGQGYATEVCQALMDLAKTVELPGGLTAVVNPENKASLRVLEKCGFENEGYCPGELDHLFKYSYSTTP